MSVIVSHNSPVNVTVSLYVSDDISLWFVEQNTKHDRCYNWANTTRQRPQKLALTVRNSRIHRSENVSAARSTTLITVFYTVSQKTPQLWQAVSSTSMDQF